MGAGASKQSEPRRNSTNTTHGRAQYRYGQPPLLVPSGGNSCQPYPTPAYPANPPNPAPGVAVAQGWDPSQPQGASQNSTGPQAPTTSQEPTSMPQPAPSQAPPPQPAPSQAPPPQPQEPVFADGEWDDTRDRTFSVVLSADEFLGRMYETEQEIRSMHTSPNGPVVYQVQIKKHLGLRGHLQDELLRIEKMLAADDPELKCLEPFRRNFPYVVAKLHQLREAESQLQKENIELPPSSENGQEGLELRRGSAHSSSSGSDSDEEEDEGKEDEKATKMEAKLEENLKKRHNEEEEKVAESHANQLAEGQQIDTVLDQHALAMQALRRRQEQERESLKRRISEYYQEKQKRRRSKKKKDGSMASSDYSSDELSGDDEEERAFKASLWETFQGMPPETFQSAFEDYAKERKTRKHARSFKGPVPATIAEETFAQVSTPAEALEASDQAAEALEASDQAAVARLFEGQDRVGTDEAAALLAQHFAASSALRRQQEQDKAAMEDKLQQKLQKKKKKRNNNKGENGQLSRESTDSSLNSSSGALSNRSDTVSTSTADFADAETQKELERLQAEFEERIRAHGRELSQDELKRLLEEYRRRQEELVTKKKQDARAVDDDIRKKLVAKKSSGNRPTSARTVAAIDEAIGESPRTNGHDLYSKLNKMQNKGSLGREEFEKMLSSYIRSQEKEQKDRRRRHIKDETATREAANSLVSRFQNETKELKHFREKEKTAFDAKLQEKLVAKKNKSGGSSQGIPEMYGEED